MPEPTNQMPYEPPRVEAVLTAEKLAREFLFAGQVTLIDSSTR